MARSASYGFFTAAIFAYCFPGWIGFLETGRLLTPGEGTIMATVLFVGAAILFFMPERAK
jgi:hypothetical protein